MKEFIKKYHKQIIIVAISIILLGSGILIKVLTNNNLKEVNNPDTNFHDQIKVTIKGEVKYPNIYYLEEGSKIKDVIILASGLTNDADTSFINLNKEVKNDEVIYITKKTSNKIDRININNANIKELKTLIDVGETLAYNIIVYRTINGPFNTIYDLLKVNGMTIKIISKNINEICLS